MFLNKNLFIFEFLESINHVLIVGQADKNKFKDKLNNNLLVLNNNFPEAY